jgi:predicted dehydrogenase
MMHGLTGGPVSRREFVKATAAAAALTSGLPAYGLGRGAGKLRVGVIGCGGRGTGAAANILEASPDTVIIALADVFPERIASARAELSKLQGMSDRFQATDDTCYTGFDGYKQLLANKDVDVVILATPPGFRPTQFAAAINAGKHVFFEKPVAVDGPGIRKVMEAGKLAADRKLCVVTGTQRRHEACYLDAMKRIRDGAIGNVVSAEVYWNQGPLWMNKRQPAWSDMEWQLRNWLYFTWLSGDHIVEQHVHNIDVMNWAIGAHPLRATGMGGRQVRTSPDYGHIFDHFAVVYEYPDGVTGTSMCRQIDGCANRVEEIIHGCSGRTVLSSGRAAIDGTTSWKFQGDEANPYVQEHRDLIAAITGSAPYINEAQRVAESTLTAIMGRMSAYTGKAVTWDQALNSKIDLSPAKWELGPIPTPEVAVPGKTPLA